MPGPKKQEWVRLGILGAVVAWLLHPFATHRLIGTGDAYWYANMLADFVTQLRAGVFPIFVGQSEYAYNGAVYPLRVAPMYQHLGGLIDLVTGHSLGFYTLQHLTVIVCGVAGIYSAYSVLCRIAPDRRWSAAGLSILYLSCPGILATIYTQDQYMTWMTVPIAPWAAYGIVRSFRKDDLVSEVCLVAPLAALWWAHSPIALWFTGIAFVSQVVRLGFVHWGLGPFKRSLVGALLFAVLAQYPFVSLAELHVPGQQSAELGALPHREMIMDGIRTTFPADVLPLTTNARALSDLQLGYGLWAVLAAALVLAFRVRSKVLWVLLACSIGLLVLLLPIPGVTAPLWTYFPETLVRITYYWPMQRFYLIIAVLLVVGTQVALGTDKIKRSSFNVAAGITISLGCAWSLWETRQFVAAGVERTASEANSARSERPENRPLMTHAYGLFAKLPARFTNGVADPAFEARLLDSTTGLPLPEPRRKLVASGQFEGTVDANPGILDLSPQMGLEAGHHYALRFGFPGTPLKGILQITGRTFFREYSLPSSGESASFGSGPTNSREVGLWTTDPAGDTVTIRFIPMMHDVQIADFAHFGAFELYELDPKSERMHLESLLPYKVTVTASAPVRLETHRVFIPGYRAWNDEQEMSVKISNEGFVAFPVPSGNHSFTLQYWGPSALRLSYWAALASWSVVLVWATIHAFSARNLCAPSQ